MPEIDEFASAVGAIEGCEQPVKFNQEELLANSPETLAKLTTLGVRGPICWGLSFIWLEYKANGSHPRFFEDVNPWEDTNTTDRATTLFSFVQGKTDQFETAADWCGLTRAMEHGEQKHRYLRMGIPDQRTEFAQSPCGARAYPSRDRR